MVAAVMKADFVKIDTASYYQNEEVVGDALKECFAKGKKREEIYVATKIWHNEYNDIEGAMRRSLKKLQLDSVDLYYLHWPAGFYAECKKPVHVIWAELEALLDKGLTKSLGVSNFTGQMLRDLLCYARHKPVVNQVELNPQISQVELVDFCLSVDVRPVAYTPVARPGGS